MCELCFIHSGLVTWLKRRQRLRLGELRVRHVVPRIRRQGPKGTHRIKLGAGSSIVQGWLAQPLGPEATVTVEANTVAKGKSHLVPIKDNDTSRPWQRAPAPTTSVSEVFLLLFRTFLLFF